MGIRASTIQLICAAGLLAGGCASADRSPRVPLAVPAAGNVTPENETAAETAARLSREMACLLYTSPSPRDQRGPRMPSSA